MDKIDKKVISQTVWIIINKEDEVAYSGFGWTKEKMIDKFSSITIAMGLSNEMLMKTITLDKEAMHKIAWECCVADGFRCIEAQLVGTYNEVK